VWTVVPTAEPQEKRERNSGPDVGGNDRGDTGLQIRGRVSGGGERAATRTGLTAPSVIFRDVNEDGPASNANVPECDCERWRVNSRPVDADISSSMTIPMPERRRRGLQKRRPNWTYTLTYTSTYTLTVNAKRETRRDETWNPSCTPQPSRLLVTMAGELPLRGSERVSQASD
jgi:hypothetical protein